MSREGAATDSSPPLLDDLWRDQPPRQEPLAIVRAQRGQSIDTAGRAKGRDAFRRGPSRPGRNRTCNPRFWSALRATPALQRLLTFKDLALSHQRRRRWTTPALALILALRRTDPVRQTRRFPGCPCPALVLSQICLCFHELGPLSISVATERHELLVECPRRLPIARSLGRLRGAVESAVPVSCRLQG